MDTRVKLTFYEGIVFLVIGKVLKNEVLIAIVGPVNVKADYSSLKALLFVEEVIVDKGDVLIL